MLYHKIYYCVSSDHWLIFVHGVGGSSTIWFKQIKPLSNHFNILLVDLRGHGKSKNAFDTVAKSKYTFEDIACDIIVVMNFNRIDRAHFVGISLGTIVIRAIGELAPGRVVSMILGGAIIRMNFRSKILMNIANLVKRYIPFLWLYALYAYILMPKKRNKESRILFITEAKNLARKEIMRWFKLTAQVNPLLKCFYEKELQIPTLYIMGEDDYMFLPQVKKIIQKHKQSTLEILADCGHVVNVEKPVLFNSITLNFVLQLAQLKN